MKLKTRQVLIEYHGSEITCEESYYGCDHCDFELHLDWMKEKMQQNLAAACEKLKEAL